MDSAGVYLGMTVSEFESRGGSSRTPLKETMSVVSVNVGRPRPIEWRGKVVETGIFKAPVTHRLAVGRFGLEGDGQADLSVHGGIDKAVYAYPAEHYPYWRAFHPEPASDWGAFGENLTTRGLLEQDACIGDRYRIGSAELVVTQPRQPCFKLGLRFGDPRVVKRFRAAERPGIYFAVANPGEIGAGDSIDRVERDPTRLSVAELNRAFYATHPSREIVDRAVAHPALSSAWREHFSGLHTRKG